MRGLAALAVVAGLLLGASPGGASPAVAAPAAAAPGSGSAPRAVSTSPPAEFGTDWDDPRTAAPPVAHPAGPSCTVRIVDHQFTDFTPYTSQYTPPAECAGPWRTVTLRLDGAVKGRQYDRLGALRIGGATILKTSTPEPSADGIRWNAEKDVTEYQQLLSSPQPVWMLLGNVVDGTYTGVLDIQVSLTFYPGRPRDRAADVVPAGDGPVTLPRDSERITADVYATGSGGGCEEFWYLAAPPSTGYSCPADDGPYREVQVLVDGQVAGIAAPYPHIYTGGWSNPFLWYAQPAPRAFDVHPLRLDLTPFAGLLTDGKPHAVTVRVEGVPVGQSGWDTPLNVLAWRDPSGRPVHGGLLAQSLSAPDHASTVDGRTVDAKGTRRLTTSGWLATSHGRVVTTVSESLTSTNHHTWGEGENPDALAATWTDTSTVAVLGAHPSVTHSAKKYTVDGSIAVDPQNRLTTTIALLDAADDTTLGGARLISTRSLRDEYRGEASWTLDVPRDQRHATGSSTEHYRLTGTDGRYDRTLTSQNGYFQP
ncbi:MAG: hypothetical protein QOD41_1807 [Cryptosporangiaceae bacterium]|nr:hypothetical protein [Cryptosporangiaceae bacterium]